MKGFVQKRPRLLWITLSTIRPNSSQSCIRIETKKNTMASKKYFDLSSYNMTTDWRRIELPFRRLAEDPEFYIFAAILLTALSAPLNFFLIIQILRYVFIND